jgi:predicted dehydrogenase
MNTLNVGLVGTGFMCKAHSLAYAAMPMFFWPAPTLPCRKIIAGTSTSSAREAASRFGFERSTADWREVIADPTIDIVDITTPNSTHAEIAIAASRAGKHVICEKPMARTALEAEEMYKAVKLAGVVNMVAFNYRRIPAIVLAKRFIEDGSIGRLLNFRGTYLQDWSASPQTPFSWRFSRSASGSGALGDIASHVLDIAEFLVGEVSAVQAMMQTYVPDRPIVPRSDHNIEISENQQPSARAMVDVDDEVLTLLRFRNGTVGTLEASRNAFGRNNYLTFEIHGTEGSICFDYERRDELQVYFEDDPHDRKGFRTINTGPAHPYGESLWPIPGIGIGYGEIKIIECYEFLKAVSNHSRCEPDFRQGYQIARIADGISDSARTKSWVEIPALKD